jgi:hypothetical protein
MGKRAINNLPVEFIEVAIIRYPTLYQINTRVWLRSMCRPVTMAGRPFDFHFPATAA